MTFRGMPRGENGEDWTDGAVAPDFAALYYETLAELTAKKNDLHSASTLLRTAQDDLQKARELNQGIAAQRDLVIPTLFPHILACLILMLAAERAEHPRQ